MYKFNASKVTQDCIQWIKDYAADVNMKRAIIGISGGKDSYVAAALCCEALGPENVIGVMMPNGHQDDLNDSVDICMKLGISSYVINIHDGYTGILDEISAAYSEEGFDISEESKINLAPRLRMSVLYTLGQTLHARVCGTGNLSEATVGYCTKWGDTACDFNPLANLTSIEVIQIGEELGLEDEYIHKTPSDGLCGLSDEDKLGIRYVDIHNYVRGIGELNSETVEKIQQKTKYSRHKFNKIPSFEYNP